LTTIDPTAARRATEAVPGIPRDADGPVFREPWEAQAFAMALALHARGVFTRREWAATLGAEIKPAQAAATRQGARARRFMARTPEGERDFTRRLHARRSPNFGRAAY
jgi:nitrile hydratase accessory protein